MALAVDMGAAMVVVKVADNTTSPQNTNAIGFAEAYRAWRRAYYNRFPNFWATLPAANVQEYALYGALEISHEHVTALRTASVRLYSLLTRLANVLQQTDDQALLDIGIPLVALPYCHLVMPEMPAVMCGRFEFAMTAQGPKLLEFNAETPTFVVELFHMNSQICKDFDLPDPNPTCQKQLVQAVQSTISAALDWIDKPQDLSRQASVVFSAYADNKEERNTIDFYRSLLERNKSLPYRTSFCGLEDLRVTDESLSTSTGERIDVLCKLYPTEHLIDDEAADGTPVGLALLDLVRKRRLAIINPPVSFLLQNKALMAVLWAMHLVRSELFTPEEHDWIEQYILPTYLDPQNDEGQPLFNGPHVVKPVYGREGVSVTIRGKNNLVEQSEQDFYKDQPMVYQQYAPLPTTTIQTEDGETEVHLVHNCFIVAGIPSAIGVRASRKRIFDDYSYFLPICYTREP